jgi:hypothetical protein
MVGGEGVSNAGLRTKAGLGTHRIGLKTFQYVPNPVRHGDCPAPTWAQGWQRSFGGIAVAPLGADFGTDVYRLPIRQVALSRRMRSDRYLP